MSPSPRVTPQEAWSQLAAGNERFVTGQLEHPNQDVEHRADLGNGQSPNAALFGCSDSRLAAEIIFDSGLGDLFVARNMGHVVAESIVASMEYAVSALGVAIIVVLAHDSCGAVAAAADQMTEQPKPVSEAIHNTLKPILPAVQHLWMTQHRDTPYVDLADLNLDDVGRVHLGVTVNSLLRSSRIISDAVAAGKLGIVGCQYRLAEGRVEPVSAVGPLDIAFSLPANPAL